MSGSEVIIRPCEERDDEPITALLRSGWAHDPTMLALYRPMHRVWPDERLIRRTLVATIGDSIVGAGTIFASTIHPRMHFVTLNVAPNWQRQGIGSRLWAALERLSDDRPWVLKMTQRDRAGMGFLHQRGFRPLMRTLTGVIDPVQTQAREWLSGLPDAAPGYRIMSDADSPATQADIALLHAAIYRQAHEWNPPIEESVDAAIAHYCGPNVLPGSQLCVYRDEQLVGAANLIANPFQPEDHEAYLVNLGTVALPPADANLLTAALIRRSLDFADEHGLRVRFEADDSHQPFQAWMLHAPATDVDHDFVIMSNA